MIPYQNIFENVLSFPTFNVSPDTPRLVSFGQVSALDGKKIRSIQFDTIAQNSFRASLSYTRRETQPLAGLGFYVTLIDKFGNAFIKDCPIMLFSFPEVFSSRRGINRLLWNKPRVINWADSYVRVTDRFTDIFGDLTYIVDHD